MSTALWSGPEVAKAAGITYRQLDYWVNSGYVPGMDRLPGSGVKREFDLEARSVIRWMGELVRQGMKPELASRIARGLHTDGRADVGPFTITTRTPREVAS